MFSMFPLFVLLFFGLFNIISAKLLILGQGNFSQVIERSHTTLVMFYAPWCSYSQAFLPTFHSLAKELEADDIQVAKVDCVVEKDLYWSNDIEGHGFPTLKIFYGLGAQLDAIQFKGERDHETVVEFARKMSDMSMFDTDLTVETYESFKELNLTAQSPLIVVYKSPYDYTTDISMLVNYAEYACKRLEFLKCAGTRDPVVAEYIGLNSQVSSLSMIRDFEGEFPVKTASDHDLETVKTMYNWASHSAYPLLVSFQPENEPLMFADSRPGFNIHIVLITDSTIKGGHFNTFLSSARTTASNFQGKCVFVYIDVNDKSNYVSVILKDIKIDRETFAGPTAMIIKSMKTEVNFYRLPAESDLLDSSMLTQWVQDFFDGSLEPSRTARMASPA